MAGRRTGLGPGGERACSAPGLDLGDGQARGAQRGRLVPDGGEGGRPRPGRPTTGGWGVGSARTADAGQALARAVDERAAHPASTRATDKRAEHGGGVEASARAADERTSGKGERTAGTSRPRWRRRGERERTAGTSRPRWRKKGLRGH